MLDFLEQNKDITSISNYKTPAKAQYFYEITWESQIPELTKLFQYISENGFKHLTVWWGTNLLFAFDMFEGVIIKNSLMGWSYDEKTQILESFSNEPIWDIAQTLELRYNQPLWHRFIGLPGSIGWAVFGNAGCFGLETESNFLEAKVLDKTTWEVIILDKTMMNFAYRSSILKQTENFFLISAKFDLSQKIEKYHSDVDNIDFRQNKQPKGNSCGSFFKNPEGYFLETPSGIDIITDKNEADSLKREWMVLQKLSAGKLIEQVWLKWCIHWGATWSEKHANFLLSDGEMCTWQDLIFLIQEAQTKVKEQFWVGLENEVRIIKNSTPVLN